jgi:hypothetical protein
VRFCRPRPHIFRACLFICPSVQPPNSLPRTQNEAVQARMEKAKGFPGDQWISQDAARVILERMSMVDEDNGRVYLVRKPSDVCPSCVFVLRMYVPLVSLCCGCVSLLCLCAADVCPSCVFVLRIESSRWRSLHSCGCESDMRPLADARPAGERESAPVLYREPSPQHSPGHIFLHPIQHPILHHHHHHHHQEFRNQFNINFIHIKG